MKRISCLLFVFILFLPLVCSASGDIPKRITEHCYVNPDGGTRLHADPMCRTVSENYLPLTEIPFEEDLLLSYSLCPLCAYADEAEPEGPEDTEETADAAVLSPSIESLDSIRHEWEELYGDARLWDWQVNADFAAEYLSGIYAYNPSTMQTYPDADAMIPEDALSLALRLIPQYDCGITLEQLEGLNGIVSSYRKPDTDDTYWSSTGSWVIDFWDRQSMECVCSIYLDAHSGVPGALFVGDSVCYVGAPGEAEVISDAVG
ncbi:MAG: hypothetical protein IJ083_04055 [Clostridia bacterium]|nr:hypothetical protein [Clostridia bacterium]